MQKLNKTNWYRKDTLEAFIAECTYCDCDCTWCRDQDGAMYFTQKEGDYHYENHYGFYHE